MSVIVVFLRPLGLRLFSASARVVDTSFSSESYAIVLPKDSALRPMLDLAVLDQIEGDWWQQTVFETLGNAQSR
ncbi:hypothetical protein [Bradyrhizobium sp. 33ap4]|uniref:hypothetical protein n=1 Tax=Bradyrhizobium sp. 33ap4 TaxID=3061630 RepID=UPI002931ADFE|nr:hypothetical protein [Bradyrhizobium sp. 33ap4]